MITILKGDCLEVMKDLSDASVDCFICDLPYGVLTQQKGATPFGRNVKGPSNSGCSWDIKIDLVAFWAQVKRLARNDNVPVLMFCTTKFGYELIKSNEGWFRYDLVWDKGHGVSFLSANKMPMRSHEMIYVFSKKGAFYKRVGTPCPLSIISIRGTKGGGHPTQKPMALYLWLLERYCPDGGTVLDPTAGSFNACFAAEELGLDSIGIEKDEVFFKKAFDIIAHV